MTVNFRTHLPFSHGLEIENHLIHKKNGELLVGEELLTIWNEMFDRAADYLKKVSRDRSTPSLIAKKIVKVEVAEEVKRERRLKFVWVTYKLGKKKIRVSVFGPDPNISQITWILELVTPPCQHLEELDWWIKTLYRTAKHGLPDQIALLPIGMSPLEESYRSGLTCGEHHHIGIPKEDLIPVYNLFRNFVPHLIALSSSSPFINRKPSGKVIIREKDGKKQVIGRCTHSHRLTKNTGQMGPNIPDYIPALDIGATRKDFGRFVKKKPPDDRMVDVFPFTDFKTIELRFFDAQPFSQIRLALVLVLQSLALKAQKLSEKKCKIPRVSSSCLFENRRKSVQFGLLSQFTSDPNVSEEFASYYNYDITTGEKVSKLFQSVKSLFIYIKDELQSFGNEEIISSILVSVLGTKEYHPPFGLVEYLLTIFDDSGQKIESLLPTIIYSEKKDFPLKAEGDLSSLIPVEVKVEDISAQKGHSLNSSLRKDLAKRKTKKVTEVAPKKAVPKKLKKPKAPLKKKPVKKTPSKPVPKKKPTPVTVEKKKEKVKKKVTPEKPKKVTKEVLQVKEVPEKVQIISAFDEYDEVEVLTPTINIEPKYQKIESKIAKVMRTRKKEIEEKRERLYLEHLERDRTPFTPAPGVSINFPNQVSHQEVFGFIELRWARATVNKLQNNPVTFHFSAYSSKKGIKKLQPFTTVIDIPEALERNNSKIPISFNLKGLKGDITIEIEAITATNETLFTGIQLSLKRVDDVEVVPKEFFITGNYGLVECEYHGTNKGKKQKGELEIFLATQSLPNPLEIYNIRFNLDSSQSLEMARTIDLLPIFHRAPFVIVSKLTASVGRFRKNSSFKVIRIPRITDLIVEWDYVSVGTPDLKLGVKSRSKYEIDFLFKFNRRLNPLTITLFVNTFPDGRTKRLATSRINREIDPGDTVKIDRIIFKTPKKCGYLFFEVDIQTENGKIPMNLISEPIGVPNLN